MVGFMLSESHFKREKSKKKKNRNSDIKVQILYDSTFMRSLEQSNSEGQKGDRWVPRAGGGRRGGEARV